jgi:glycosyltransferase involved in cell wall biosynthesis
LLASYVTTFAYRSQSLSGTLLRRGLRLRTSDPEALLQRRRVTEVPDALVATHPLPEYLRMLAMQSGLGPVVVDRVWEVTELAFARHVARRHLHGTRAVYGYSHAALEPFQVQASRGGLRVYEVPHAHHATVTALLQPEIERYPELRTAYVEHTSRLDARRNRRRDEELRLADLVIVNSTFARDSFLRAGTRPERIHVVPLGAPPAASPRPRPARGPFVFLSAGNQSAAKGTHYLLEAWRKLKPKESAELWLVGTMQLPEATVRDLPGTVVRRPAVSRGELFALYQRAGALVFPSLFEGFGMVITEAMSQGLPVITTPNTAGRDLIESGRNGLLVPVHDAEALARAMEWCLLHPAEAFEMGQAAAATASSWQWADYRAALAAAVQALIGAGGR